VARRPCGPLHRSVCKPRRVASNLSRDETPFPCSAGDSPDPRQRPFGLGQRPYPPGYGFPVPFGGWRSLLGSSCARCGFGPSFRRSSGLLAGWPDHNGVATFRTDELRRGRAPSLLRGRGVYDRSKARSRSGGPCRRVSHPAAIFAYAASMKVHLRSPFPSFPGPVGRDDSDFPWALPACCRTLRYLALARVGNRQRHISGSWRLSPRSLIRSDIVSHWPSHNLCHF
jgi:hypothetical protein